MPLWFIRIIPTCRGPKPGFTDWGRDTTKESRMLSVKEAKTGAISITVAAYLTVKFGRYCSGGVEWFDFVPDGSPIFDNTIVDGYVIWDDPEVGHDSDKERLEVEQVLGTYTQLACGRTRPRCIRIPKKD
ncbi:hypothetical protein MRB53_014318 [Persea americana]|uniref:Uncharacterized protein n=1 Tax=Persea americana TaxID=3435 RepID=A0ACC2KAJ3_PERAE|nr:hypothetical protein MRB53_014318 [Persea americana]